MSKRWLFLPLLLLASPALAQTCPTRPVNQNDNSCASTAYVANQIAATVIAPGSITLANGDILIGSVSNVAAAQALSGDCTITNLGVITCTKTNGVAFAPSATTDTTNAGNISSGTLANGRLAGSQNTVKGAATSAVETDLAVPSCSTASSALTWTTNTGFGCNSIAGGGGSGTLVSIVTYSSSQTITIPATATKAFIRMTGGSGGSGGTGASCSTTGCGTGATGAPGYLEKYLTGLTAGNTVVFTQGALGAAGANTGGNGGNGTASTLASGTQVITTLTANGSNGSLGTNVDGTFTSSTVGGTATNGDINTTGVGGVFASSAVAGQNNPLTAGVFGLGFTTGSRTGTAGNPGLMVIFWFT